MAKSEIYAGFWVRFVAVMIDAVIVGVPLHFASLALFGAQAVDPQSPTLPPSFWPSLFFQFGVAFCYSGVLQGYLNGTPGKRLMGLRLMADNLKPIGIPRAIARFFATFVSSLVFCLGYIWVGFAERKQGWHDKIAGTVVVKANLLPSSAKTALKRAA